MLSRLINNCEYIHSFAVRQMSSRTVLVAIPKRLNKLRSPYFGTPREELDTNYNKFREYEKTLERVKQMIDGSVTILRLPLELSWDNIKKALQATYKQGIQQISVYQFLVRNKEFLDLESGVKGMSLLSDQLTSLLMSEMGYLFRYLTPIGFY